MSLTAEECRKIAHAAEYMARDFAHAAVLDSKRVLDPTNRARALKRRNAARIRFLETLKTFQTTN